MERIKAKVPIAFKLVTGIIIIFASISAFFYLYFPSRIRQTLLEKEIINAKVLIDVVSVGAGIALSGGDYYILAVTIRAAKEFPNVGYIVFLDSANKQIATYNPDTLQIDRSGYSMDYGQIITKEQLLIRSPLTYEEQEYGSLLLSYSLSDLNLRIEQYKKTILTVAISILLIGSLLAIVLSERVTSPIRKLVKASSKVIQGNLEAEVTVRTRDELSVLSNTFNHMVKSIREKSSELENRNQELQAQQAELRQSNSELVKISKKLEKSFKQLDNFFLISIDMMGIAGTDGYFKKVSNSFARALGYTREELLSMPFINLIHEEDIEKTAQVMERQKEGKDVMNFENRYRKKSGEHIWLSWNATVDPETGHIYASARDVTLEKEQDEKLRLQTEMLEDQQEELQQSNQHLEEQTRRLEASQEELKTQQEELLTANEVLEEKSEALEKKNNDLTEAQVEIELKSKELERASQFKSEFLANMSHELRTPLNSILLLSQLLAENMDDNLGKKQVEYAQVINKAGESLLGLINDILDLSKIESGKMVMDFTDLKVEDTIKNLEYMFRPVAEKKNLQFSIKVSKGTPEVIRIDQVRLEQVLKNFLSNAFKFTEEGKVELKIFKAPPTQLRFKHIENNDLNLAFAVSDSGIGIPSNLQNLVFEAFQQADGSIQRKYGGTGLGLSICKEIAHLFGGDITLESLEGKGSTFTVFLPQDSEAAYKQNLREPSLRKQVVKPGLKPDQRAALRASKPQLKVLDIPEEIPDDRKNIKKKEKTILIIEDDVHFAELLLNFSRERGYKGVVAVSGDKGVEYAQKYKPYAIVLDIKLPVMDGWAVMEELKRDSRTKSIPVHIFSNLKEARKESLESGALDFVDKPVNADQLNAAFNRIEAFQAKKIKSILLVDENEKHQLSLKQYLDNGKWNLFSARNTRQAFQELGKREIDCLILDLELPGANGFEMLQKIKQEKKYESLPVIVYTGKGISPDEEKEIRTYASTIIMKTAKSYERILEELNLFLHVVDNHQGNGPKVRPYHNKEALQGKQVLLIDDDIRNIFSLTGLLEDKGMQVLSADNGADALKLLEKETGVDVVVADIMVTGINGCQTIKQIRKQESYRSIPIIAVTAKTLPKERAKCIDAGASDYICKPIDSDQLLSLLRVWLYDQPCK